MCDLLIKLPTRERPDRAVQTIGAFKALAEGPVRFLVSIDEDDSTMNNQAMLDRLHAIGDVRVAIGQSKTKVQACNADLQVEGFDILILASDDMRPMERGYDRIIKQDMKALFPNFDGALHYNDGHVGDKLCTLPVLGYHLWIKFGYVYHPDYVSLWCDNEYTDVLRGLRRLPYSSRVLIEHNHPSFGQLQRDPLLDKTESYYALDEATYRRRAAKVRTESLIAFDFPDILLSVCICSLNARSVSRRTLLDELNRQIDNHPRRMQLEIWLEIDGGETRVGTKRNRMIDRARGRFVVFVDDDDMVEPTYIDDLVAAVLTDPEADCIQMDGIMTTDGQNPRRFVTSLLSGRYHESNGVFYRTPNHVSPVRRDHATHCRFPDTNCGEDAEYARRLMASGRLRRETPTYRALYRYLFSPSNTATQRR